jgi:hypothetical protein
MVTVVLRLFFFGLVAFTPDEFQCNGDMRALLVDARQPPVASDGCPIHPHTPALFYYVADRNDCKQPCRNDRGLCRCDLEGGRLLDIGPTEDKNDLCFAQQNNCRPKAGANPDCSERGFDFIPKLRSMRLMNSRMALHPDCDRPCPALRGACADNHPICKVIAAQINFRPFEFHICRMAGQAEDGSPKCPRFNLRPLTSQNISNLSFLLPSRQVAEIVSFEAEIEAEERNPQTVTLTLAAFDGGGSDDIIVPVVREGNELYANLVIANFMEQIDHARTYSRCDQNFVARDFEMFHDLTTEPLYPLDRTIPQTKENADLRPISPELLDQGYECNSRILKIFRRDILRAGDSRPICPQAAVAPASQ